MGSGRASTSKFAVTFRPFSSRPVIADQPV
jgi:hypothetical protein